MLKGRVPANQEVALQMLACAEDRDRERRAALQAREHDVPEAVLADVGLARGHETVGRVVDVRHRLPGHARDSYAAVLQGSRPGVRWDYHLQVNVGLLSHRSLLGLAAPSCRPPA